MRVLLSTIGSRGDVQPLVALAQHLRALGQDVHLCAPPDFCDWIAELGFAVTPIGPDLRKMTGSRAPSLPDLSSPDVRRRLTEASVAAQFDTLTPLAQRCDVIVGATALQVAAPSVAEARGIPYVFAAYCPRVLPSSAHPPIPLPGMPPATATDTNDDLWTRDTARFNETFRDALNTRRTALGLANVDDVRSHIFTDRPWLAADPVLGPWPGSDDAVFQPGAWLVTDRRALEPALESFLDAGEAPIYFGLGSMRATPGIGTVMVRAARALGRRAIVSRGWADLSGADGDPDCLSIDEVNQQTLFARVAATVHHGGAGTTTTAALAGAPQVIIPQMYDQPYWADRVQTLGIGQTLAKGMPTEDALVSALAAALTSEVAARAQSIARAIRTDGVDIASRQLLAIADY